VEAVPGPRQLNWTVTRSRGDAGTFHARTASAGRVVWVFEPTVPAVVLGSAQREAAVDRSVSEALGITVVRRRSGGGAVLVVPGEMVWLDVVIAADDPLWQADVGRSMHWVGETWAAALATLGVAPDVHRGAMRRPPWSSEVCFAGVGPGEVLDADGRKLVGISQRRSREWARFQTMLHLRWRPELVAALVSPPRPTATQIAGIAAEVPAPAHDVIEAMLHALP
jgi:lipoate---protein ligase